MGGLSLIQNDPIYKLLDLQDMASLDADCFPGQMYIVYVCETVKLCETKVFQHDVQRPESICGETLLSALFHLWMLRTLTSTG